MENNLPITEIMTKDIISVHPETPILDVAKLLNDHSFNGMPVVDKDNVLVGIITEYDLISSGSSIHLPTLQKVLGSLSVFKKDKWEFNEDVESLTKLQVKDVMNKEPLTLSNTASFLDALQTFQEHHRVNPIPVIDAEKKVVGVVSRFDILKPLKKVFDK